MFPELPLTSEKDVMVKKWGFHAVKGTWGAEVVPELKPNSKDIIINKKGYNGFFRTKLENVLRSLDVTRLILTGIHTHVCVLLTGVSAFEFGFDVTAIEDGITTGYIPNHENRLRFFKTHIGTLENSNIWISRTNS